MKIRTNAMRYRIMIMNNEQAAKAIIIISTISCNSTFSEL